MSDIVTPAETQVDPQPQRQNEPVNSVPDGKDERAVAWERERSSLLGQIKDGQAQLASVLKERDQFKAQFSELEPKAKEADQLRLKVEDFVRRDRELAIVTKIRTAAPHAGDLEVRGVLAALHEGGKIDRYSEDAENTAKKAIELLKTEAPNLFRVPTGASGSAAITHPSPERPRVKHPIYGG
ncbi:hypothetical protein OV203_26055 [Nannocystis sp. ILAH1]|uniref:hypothetical protein n=1 Tax=Nannocystis sp. ILAH1 TaxID=2996789 RepID=UPI00227009DE|nr:hypothetical protein [Nannocystis sp. ILAH1]MCY0990634.1 hypothetical protein [Nannocystis sp. ILAH1]